MIRLASGNRSLQSVFSHLSGDALSGRAVRLAFRRSLPVMSCLANRMTALISRGRPPITAVRVTRVASASQCGRGKIFLRPEPYARDQRAGEVHAAGPVLPCPAHEGARTTGFVRYGPYWPAALRQQHARSSFSGGIDGRPVGE